ncbi:carbonic anhydrase/acetyltransferase [Turneriella parva DSM 21527]|uniref:Carbonic anhydrase/acetyltransferase n=2 Tax=Turneriella TaxID=338321 RepID=I4B2F4_TURPD|nr:gamma carbonic anhydrase family protein [Turneriella parva]AFM11461.1 carbonic anhydrase/acetyltransferase [Turneriella parva DSM 21527]
MATAKKTKTGPGKKALPYTADKIHPTAFIHERATVYGDITMGENSSLWPGVVVRADMNAFVLGNYVNIQDNSTLHSDSKRGITIGDYTLVGHHAMIHGCTIGRGVLIGIGSVILDDAQIGDGAMITAGCMIRGGTKIPPQALVTPDGSSIRIFENKARTAYTIAGSLEYVELARRMQKGLWGPFSRDEENAFLARAKEIWEQIKAAP